MRKLLRVYGALMKASVSEALEYRAQVFLWLVASIFPLVMMTVWLALVDEAQQVAGWDRADFLSYYIGMMLVNQLTGSWILWDWDDDLRTGNLSVKLLKPSDPLHYFISKQIGWKVLVLIFMLPVVAAVAVISPEVRFPLTPLTTLAFVAAVVLGFIEQTFMATAFAVLGFWSTQVRNLYQLWFGVGQFLSGFIAPLAMFPLGIRSLAVLLPYRGYVGFPLEILTGQLAGPEIQLGFLVTLFWTLVFVLAYRILWRAGLRRYEAVGA